jgi:hypothetical protein
MAKRRTRRSGRQNGNDARTTSGGETARTLDGTAESSMVPQVLLGTVNGIETVAVGALQLARNVLVSAVSGAADIGAEAVTATFAGTRGVVAAASRMVGDIATTAQSTLQETVSSAKQLRGSALGRVAARRPLAKMASGPADPSVGGDSLLERAATRRKATGPRAARQPRTTVAA